MKNRRILSIKYMSSDFSTAVISWICFYYFRKTVIESSEFVIYSVTPQLETKAKEKVKMILRILLNIVPLKEL